MLNTAEKENVIAVSEIMTPNPVFVNTDSTVREAIDKMLENDIRHLPVLRASKLVGILSDRDLKLHELLFDSEKINGANSEKSLELPVSEVMQTAVVAVEAEDELPSVIRLMIENKIGAVPVVDSDSFGLVGIVSYIDILKKFEEIL